ncbi:MAG: glutamate--tRNA ligase [Candidatus Eisenbacteria bacterium]|uniref:Glutamate--tRNA ligase n=1 Tax=Eiseniibacteriota bacterium TaxID=2212470 RepID=A0A9D6L5T0_UNCEI|nr:glutamate--tRNA ligase [Candidatus Eisenbacteria bacterium]
MSVRVRFAPSPTGWLHVGGARTAYFNWLYARQHQGALVLRIEDTDVERSSEASESGVLDDLRWLGLTWDEGPDRGGAFAPYRQSERLALYRDRAAPLVASGAAYPCFCTDDELEARRKAALAAGRPPHYDGRCRDLTAAERDARRREGRPESVRFAVTERDWTLDDLVRGEVRFPAGMVGDFVLLRSNGLPTYNFACVVDDAGMRISHVIRAEEHLSNTARQLMLYAALGETAPRFAHVPLILNRDRTKMSKRAGEAAVSVADWRDAGYLPEALLSYLALLGFHPGDDREILSRDEMLAAFSLDRVGKSGSVFDADRLRWVNAHDLHHADGAALRAAGGKFLPAAAHALGPERLDALLAGVRSNLTTLADLPRELAPFLDELPAIEPDAAAALAAPQAAALCAALATAFAALAEWSAERVKSAIPSAGRDLGLKGRDLFQPVRAALTGRTHGPELPTVAELLGRERCIARLRAAAARTGRAT